MKIIHLTETDSTNNYLSDWSEREPVAELTTVQTDFQSAGKGQRGNHWEAERGQNLLFSFVLYPSFLEARRQFILSQLISLSICETLGTLADGLCIKWPNDIYWQEKKMGGILIENDLRGTSIARSITGVGLNINQAHFCEDLPNPVSLRQVTGKEYDCEALLRSIMQRVATYYADLQRGSTEHIVHRYGQALFRKEGFHRYADDEGTFTARIAGVEPDGHLRLEDTEGRLRLYAFKEVQFIF